MCPLIFKVVAQIYSTHVNHSSIGWFVLYIYAQNIMLPFSQQYFSCCREILSVTILVMCLKTRHMYLRYIYAAHNDNNDKIRSHIHIRSTFNLQNTTYHIYFDKNVVFVSKGDSWIDKLVSISYK